MKKVLIALLGFALVAFPACSGGGSKEFKDSKQTIEKIQKAVNDAKTCQEVQEAALGLIVGALASGSYAEGEKMTDAEKQKIEKITKDLSDAIEKKLKKLGCESVTLF